MSRVILVQTEKDLITHFLSETKNLCLKAEKSEWFLRKILKHSYFNIAWQSNEIKRLKK